MLSIVEVFQSATLDHHWQSKRISPIPRRFKQTTGLYRKSKRIFRHIVTDICMTYRIQPHVEKSQIWFFSAQETALAALADFSSSRMFEMKIRQSHTVKSRFFELCRAKLVEIPAALRKRQIAKRASRYSFQAFRCLRRSLIILFQ